MPEFDEFGIPIKKKSQPQSQVEVDEFGIPVKKKEPTSGDSLSSERSAYYLSLPADKEFEKPKKTDAVEETTPEPTKEFVPKYQLSFTPEPRTPQVIQRERQPVQTGLTPPQKETILTPKFQAISQKPSEGEDKTQAPTLTEAQNIMGQTFMQFGADASRSLAVLAHNLNLFGEYDEKKVEDLASYKLADWFEKNKEYVYPVPQNVQESTTGQLIGGGTNLLMNIAGGSAGKAAKLGTVLLPSAMGAMQNGSQEYKRAYDTINDSQNLSDEEFYAKYGDGLPYSEVIANKQQMSQLDPEEAAFKQFTIAGGIGALEGLPIMSYMRRVDGATGGLFHKVIGKHLASEGTDNVLAKTFLGGLEEGTEEAVSQYLTNVSANQIYDKTRSLYEGVAENGGLGFLLGGMVNGLTATLQAKRSNPNNTVAENSAYDATLKYLDDKKTELKDVADNDYVKPFDDSQKVQELKSKKAQLESDMVNPDIDDSVKADIKANIDAIDAEIQQTKVDEIAADNAKVAINAEVQQTESDIQALEAQAETGVSEETKAILQRKIDEKRAEQLQQLDLLKESEETNDNQENITGLPSEIGVGEESVQAEPIETTSGETSETSGILQAKEIKPIRQLGTGANVYFETPKYRVNENAKNDNVVLNIGDEKSEVPLANIEFDNPKEAVFVAKKLEELAPQGLTQGYHNIEKIITNLKEEYKNEQPISEQQIAEGATTESVPENVQPSQSPKTTVIGEKQDLKGNKKASWMNLAKTPKQKTEVETALKDGEILKSVKEGKITSKDAQDIIQSAGLVVPKEIKNFGKISMRGKTPMAKRKTKDPVIKLATSEPLHDIKGIVMQHFIQGGKINRKGMEQLLGDKKGKNIQGEVNARMSYKGINDNPQHTIDGITHSIYENLPEGVNIEMSEIRDAVEDVVNSFSSTKQMATEIVDRYYGGKVSEQEKQKSKKFDELESSNPDQDFDQEASDYALSAMDGMTDEQLTAIDQSDNDSWLKGLDEEVSEQDINDNPFLTEDEKVAAKASRAERINSALESLKIDTKGTLNAFGIIPATWNALITTMQTSIKAGVAVSEAINDLVKAAKKASQDFDEKGFRAKMKEIFGDEAESTEEVVEEKIEKPKQKTKTMKVSERILESEKPTEQQKSKVKELGVDYLVDKLEVTNDEAREFVDSYEANSNLDEAMNIVMDMKNDMKGLVRGTVGAILFDRYTKLSNEATTIKEKEELDSKAAKIAKFSAMLLNQSGKTINAGKIWKKLLSNNPTAAIQSLTEEYAERNKPVLDKDKADIKEAKSDLDELLKSEEGKRIIAEKVSSEIDKKAEQLFGKEQKQKISNFFDSLLINNKGKVYDATMGLPVAVWNGAVKTVKESVLLGASTANAIKAGIDYVKSKYNGEWKEKEFELLMESGIKKLKPRPKYAPSEKTKNQILDKWSKRLTKLKPEQRRKLLAQSIQELNDSGALSDEKFSEFYAEALGLPTVTQEMKVHVNDLIGKINGAEKAATEFKSAFEEGKNVKEAEQKYKKAVREARMANEQLSSYFREKKNVWDTLSTIMQGNLLTPASLVANIYSNVLLQPLRFMSGGVASMLDYTISQGAKYKAIEKLFGKERTIDLIARSKGAWKGIIPGIKEGIEDTRYGLTSEELNERDLNNKLQPLKSATELLERYFKGRKISTEAEINNWAETLFGVPADVMFRLLNLGDKPFRRAAETGKAFELAKLKRLKGKELERFLLFPDEKSAEQIKQAGDEATFQKESKLANFIQQGTKMVKNVPHVGNFLHFLLKGLIPYVKTPTNIITETLDYALPPITFARATYAAKDGNRRKSLELFGKAIIGSMISAVAFQLLKDGLISGPPEEDDKPKEKATRYENVPPNSINISALNRILAGGSGTIKDDDVWVNYTKTGVVGSILSMYASMGNEKTQEEINNLGYTDIGVGAIGSLAKTSLQQSFLQGTNSLINAMTKGESESNRFITNYINALTSTAYPNTLGAISRASTGEVKNTRDMTLGDEIANMFKYKMFMGDELPARVTLWGKKVANAPEGRGKYAYNLFDVTKYRNVDTDNFGFKLYEQWNKTKNGDWLPTIPTKNLSINGEKVTLTPKELEQFQIYVGQERKALVEAYVNSESWETDTEEERLDTLKSLYEEGRDNGKTIMINKTKRLYDIENK